MFFSFLIYNPVALFEGIFLIIIGFYLIYVFKPQLLPFFSFFCMIIAYFMFFIPTVYCEGIEDPFSLVNQISDLSSLESKNIIREAYSVLRTTFFLKKCESIRYLHISVY